MIQAQQLSKTFTPGRGRVVHAVRDASFTVNNGEIFGLLGPNGAGKTTLLRMLATIISPTSGHCVVAGHRSDTEPRQVRASVGFLSGSTRLYRRLTAREVLRYFGRLYGLTDQYINQRTQHLADMLQMHPFLDQRCHGLSTGQSQKVSIARVIIHDPSVLILDEPTLGLDIVTSRTILDFIADARGRGSCIIFSTHYMTEAELLCDRIGFIYDGSILAIGTTDQLYQQTQTDNLKDAYLAMADRQAQAL